MSGAPFLPLPSVVRFRIRYMREHLPRERAFVARQARAMYGPRWRERCPRQAEIGLFGLREATFSAALAYREVVEVCKANGWDVRAVVAAALAPEVVS